MSKIDLKYLISVLGVPILVYVFMGNVLGTFENSTKWITPNFTKYGTSIAISCFLLLYVLARKRILYWGKLRIATSRYGFFILIGILTTLWLPRGYELFKSTVNEEDVTPSKNESERLLFSDPKALHILLLPFRPDIDCIIRTTDFESQLMERYKTKAEEEKLDIEISLLKEPHCPSTISEAKEIAFFYNADMIIWGQFEDECVTDKKIRIRYTLTFDLPEVDQTLNIIQDKGEQKVNLLSFGDSEKQLLPTLDTLRQGYLQEDIDYLINFVLGVYEFQKEKYWKSVELFKGALSKKYCDENALAYLGYSLMYGAVSDTQLIKALYNIDYYSWHCPESTNLLFCKGYVFRELGVIDSAIVYFKRTIDFDTSLYYHLQAKVFLGDVLTGVGKYQEAQNFFEEAVQERPDWPFTYIFYGRFFRKTKNYKEAKYCYERLVTLDSNFLFQSLYELGLLNLEFNNPGKAEMHLFSLLDKVLSTSPDSYKYISNIYYYLAWVEIEKENPNKAMDYLKQGLSYFDGNEKILNLIDKVNLKIVMNENFDLIYIRVD